MEVNTDFAVVIPLANEEAEFAPFAEALQAVLTKLGNGSVYFVVDTVSKDNTLELSRQLSSRDQRFVCIYEPLNKNVVDAYLRGYREAYERGHEIIIEMDAGLSHDPGSLPEFLSAFAGGFDCVFGSRFMKGGAMPDSSLKRKILSKGGTLLSNFLLGSQLHDMTSGYQGFKREVVKQVLDYGLKSKAHFYQTEVRYLLRKKKWTEIPITYRAPSPSVSQNSINNSLQLLFYYFIKRISFRASAIV